MTIDYSECETEEDERHSQRMLDMECHLGHGLERAANAEDAINATLYEFPSLASEVLRFAEVWRMGQ